MEPLSNEIKTIYSLFTANLQPKWLEFILSSSDEHLALLRNIESDIKVLAESLAEEKELSKRIEIQREHKKRILNLLEQRNGSVKETNFDSFYSNFEEAIDSVIAGQERLIRIKEPFNGYTLRFRENPFTTLRKMLVNVKRAGKLVLKRFCNPFRRLFKRKPLELIVYRERRVLLRGMAKHFILNEFLSSARNQISHIKEAQSKAMIEVWSLDEALDANFQKELTPDADTDWKETPLVDADALFSELYADYEAVTTSVKADVEALGNEVFMDFNSAFGIIDTLDMRYKSFGKNKMDKRKGAVKALLSGEVTNWANTHVALTDDWYVDMEITLLYYSVLDEYTTLHNSIGLYITEVNADVFERIKSFIDISQKTIEGAASSKSELKTKIADVRSEVSGQLIDRMLTQATGKLTGCFTKYFDTLHRDTLELIQQVSKNRGFIKNKKYTKGVKAEDVKYISPRELLNFEALPEFKESTDAVEQWADDQLEKVRVNLLGLGTVCDFTLESTLLMLNERGDATKKAVESALEGFERALGHLTKAEAILTQVQATIQKDVGEAVHKFDDDIQKLKNTENILELNLKIARIKASDRTEEYKKKVEDYIVRVVPLLKESASRYFKRIQSKVDRVKQRLGIAEESKHVSFELSEFIDQTQQSLKTLPFVYQRLYQLNPTDEERFFVNRESEMKQLSKSLDDWRKDRFVTLALIGEKGSGITSLINYFLSKSNLDLDIIKHTLDSKIYSSQAYLQLFSKLLGADKFETNDEIINYINKLDDSLIIVLENLQHLFLKQVGGFDCKNMLFELMANTMKRVLWIGAYTSHTWTYLDRTIHISNYFTNEIRVEPMSQQTLEEIIFKRNRLSGYHISFNPSTQIINSKSYSKLGIDERQEFLKQHFFANLLKMSAGNISLAQLYWLRSTWLVNDDEIQIMPIPEFDFSFVKSLSSDELFALQALILHDGLEINDFTKVLGKPLSVSRNLLTPMFEKGLLIKPRSKYNINPIIFKPVANYLASRNFIN